MTAQEIIARIKAEVERLYDEANNYDDSCHYLGEVLSVLSDLEKECQWSAEDETKIAYICDVMSGKELVPDISPSYRSEIIEFAKSLRPAKVKSEKPTNPTLQEQPVDWQKVAKAHAKDQPLGQDNDGNLVYLQEQPVCEGLEGEADKLSDALFCEFFPQDGDMITPNDFRVGLRKFARHFYELGCRRTAEKYDEIEYERQRADVCEGLEKASQLASEVCYPLENFSGSRRSYRKGFIAGAKWQKEQMMDEWLKDRDGCFWDGVEEGKKAMREQMMNEAVEGEVCGRVYDHINVRFADGVCKYLEPKNISHIPADVSKYKVGDKVHIIVCKKED